MALDASLRVAILSATAADARRYFVVLRLAHPTEESSTIVAYNNIARTEVVPCPPTPPTGGCELALEARPALAPLDSAA